MINISFYPLIIFKIVTNNAIFKIKLYGSIIIYLQNIEIFLKILYEKKIFKNCFNLEKTQQILTSRSTIFYKKKVRIEKMLDLKQNVKSLVNFIDST